MRLQAVAGSLLFFFALTLGGVMPMQAGEPEAGAVRLLLSRLDLERPGLERVKAAKDDPAAAAKALLAYYRARTAVKHPVDRAKRGAVRGKYAKKGSLDIADDALKNILITCPHYPRFDFGPDINWLKNRHKKRDNEWLWQLNRHGSWRHLARAWWHTGEEKYAQAYVRQLLDWIRKCPRRKNSPAWRTIEAGLRGKAWTNHFQHFLDAPCYTPDVLVRHLNSFYEHAHHLTSRRMLKNNWGLLEARGVSAIAMTFPEFRAAAGWRRKAFVHLNAMMKVQVRADGHHFEQSLNYHLVACCSFSDSAEMAVANGLEKEFPPEYWRGLERMCEVPMKLYLPDGNNAQFGDDHTEWCNWWNPSLSKWARFFKREDVLYVATTGAEGKPPAETAFALKDSGFYSMRSGWDKQAIMLILKCGPNGGGHCQPDNGTFEISAFGRRLTPDSGSYIYHGDAKGRRWFRQTRVHQTLTLGGKNTAYAPKLRLWKPGAELDVLVVENRSYKGLVHRRAVLFVRKKFFVLVDEALGSAAGDVDIHFVFPPGKAVFEKAALTARTSLEGANLLVRAFAQPGLALEREEGKVSFKYGTKGPRPAFRFRLKKTAEAKGVRFVTLLVPYEGAKPPEASVTLVGKPPPGARRVELDVQVGKVKARVGYSLDKGR